MRFVFLSLLIFLSTYSHAQFQLSDEAEIAVVTLGPYQGEPWSAFGHSGFRIVDKSVGVDWFYNYGLYDFEQENFFLNFAKGLLKYRVGVQEWERYFRFQKYQKRYVKLQYLNLTQQEKQQLFDFLQNNIKPENAEYLYHYVFDNCATKIRDVVLENFPGRITLDLSYKEEGKTFRQLMDDYLAQQDWGDFGIDVGLGSPVDQEAKAEEYMFLPPYIYKAFSGGTIERGGELLPLVKESVDAYIPQEPSSLSVWITPFNFFVILFFVTGLITHRNLKVDKRTKWIDYFLFGFAGFVGWWVVYLWIGTEHMSTNNLDILWAIPFHFPLAFFSGKERYRSFFKKYFKVFAFWYSGLLLVWGFWLEPIHESLVPFVLTLVLRSVYLSHSLGKKKV